MFFTRRLQLCRHSEALVAPQEVLVYHLDRQFPAVKPDMNQRFTAADEHFSLHVFALNKVCVVKPHGSNLIVLVADSDDAVTSERREQMWSQAAQGC